MNLHQLTVRQCRSGIKAIFQACLLRCRYIIIALMSALPGALTLGIAFIRGPFLNPLVTPRRVKSRPIERRRRPELVPVV